MNSDSAFPVDLTKWSANKIKGGIAEAACRAHFEALGYAVESTGIEHIAPQYCKLNGYPEGNYIADVKKIQKLPDFIISRIHPSTAVTLMRNQAGKADAVFVEAKYRSEVVLEEFTQKMLDDYQYLLEKEIHFIVYLVCKRYKKKAADLTYCSDSFVFLNFFNPDISKTQRDSGWHKAGDSEKLVSLSLYQGKQDGQDFNQAYLDIVHPVLQEMLG